MKWNDWMAEVAGRLTREHNISPGYVRPTPTWRRMFRQGIAPAEAADRLAEKLRA